MGQILSFDLDKQIQWFKVTFESESRDRNRILEVEFQGFKLDVPELRYTHPLLYSRIKDEMQREANEHWNKEEPIPTLAYQPGIKKLFDSMNKAFSSTNKLFFSILFIFFLSSVFAQDERFTTAGGQIVYSPVYNVGFGAFGGRHVENNYIGLNTQVYPIGSVRNVPVSVSLEYGYTIGSIQPFVSVGFYTTGGESVKMSEGSQGFEFGGGISYLPRTAPLKIQIGMNRRSAFVSIGEYIKF